MELNKRMPDKEFWELEHIEAENRIKNTNKLTFQIVSLCEGFSNFEIEGALANAKFLLCGHKYIFDFKSEAFQKLLQQYYPDSDLQNLLWPDDAPLLSRLIQPRVSPGQLGGQV